MIPPTSAAIAQQAVPTTAEVLSASTAEANLKNAAITAEVSSTVQKGAETLATETAGAEKPAAAEDANIPKDIAGTYTGDDEKLITALISQFSAAEPLTEEVKVLISDAVATGTRDMKEIYKIAASKAAPKYDMSKRYFNYKRLNVLLAGILLFLFINYYTYSARKGKDMFIRKIGGLAAIDEAVGRATEMGKPVLFIPGIYDMDDIQTIAGVSILGHVAKKTAEYETPLLVPCTRSLVMSTAQEVVKESYLKTGRIDSFRPENIRYLTDDQFGYVAGVDGIMMREKPAANFYLGVFFAESLILAETGHHVGAIQIAGTAMVHQIPFFVAACDYTLIGEELFAASAYLSREPMQMGALKGQDVAKFLIIIVIVLGIIMETAGYHIFANWFATN